MPEGGRGEGTPLVSVVIASVNGLPWIANCLAGLERQDSDVAHEVIVVDRCGEGVREALRRDFPGVDVIAAEGNDSIPALRAIGIDRSLGRLVAMLSDVCRPARTWLGAARSAHEDGRPALGGAVEAGVKRSGAAWAAFLCEYSRFMPPLDRGSVREIPGSNAVYSREVLQDAAATFKEGVWEYFLHRRLRERGVPLYSDPDLLVSHDKDLGYLEFLSQRYHHSRSFAGMRLRGASFWKRLAYVCATPLLPALLFLRIGATTARKRKSLLFLRALPALPAFLLAWAWGEAVGALAGAGGSLERVR